MFGLGPISSAPISSLPTGNVTRAESIDNFRPYRSRRLCLPGSEGPLPDVAAPAVVDFYGESSNWAPNRPRRHWIPEGHVPRVPDEAPGPTEFAWLEQYPPPFKPRRTPSGVYAAANLSVGGVLPIPDADVVAECPYRPKRPDSNSASRFRPDQCERD